MTKLHTIEINDQAYQLLSGVKAAVNAALPQGQTCGWSEAILSMEAAMEAASISQDIAQKHIEQLTAELQKLKSNIVVVR